MNFSHRIESFGRKVILLGVSRVAFAYWRENSPPLTAISYSSWEWRGERGREDRPQQPGHWGESASHFFEQYQVQRRKTVYILFSRLETAKRDWPRPTYSSRGCLQTWNLREENKLGSRRAKMLEGTEIRGDRSKKWRRRGLLGRRRWRPCKGWGKIKSSFLLFYRAHPFPTSRIKRKEWPLVWNEGARHLDPCPQCLNLWLSSFSSNLPTHLPPINRHPNMPVGNYYLFSK